MIMTFSKTGLEAGSWLFLCLLFRLGGDDKVVTEPQRTESYTISFDLMAE